MPEGSFAMQKLLCMVYEVDGQQPLKHNNYPVRQTEMRNKENKKRVRENESERERKRRKEGAGE